MMAAEFKLPYYYARSRDSARWEERHGRKLQTFGRRLL